MPSGEVISHLRRRPAAPLALFAQQCSNIAGLPVTDLENCATIWYYGWNLCNKGPVEGQAIGTTIERQAGIEARHFRCEAGNFVASNVRRICHEQVENRVNSIQAVGNPPFGPA